MVLGRRLGVLRHPGGQPTDRGAGQLDHAGRRVVPRRHNQLRHRDISARHRRTPRDDRRRRGRLDRVVVGPTAARDRRVRGLPAGSRGEARRRCRRVSAQRRRGRGRRAGRGERGRDLGGVQPGRVRRRRDSQAGPGGAESPSRHRRLPVRRQAHRPATGADHDPGGDADAAGHRGGAPPWTRPRGLQRSMGSMVGGSRSGRPAGDPAGPVRAPALGDVLVGNHRQAKRHRARSWRCAAGAPEIPGPATGPASRRAFPVVLVHQLDDVEPAGVRAAGRHHHRALRRQPDLPDDGRPVAGGRRRRGHGVRRRGRLPAGLRQTGSGTRQVVFARWAANGGVDRFTAAGVRIRLGAGGAGTAGSGDLDVRWHRRLHGLHRRKSDCAGGRRRTELHLPGRGHRGLGRPGDPDHRGRGRTGPDQAHAVDAGVLLERRRRQPLSRRLLRQVSGCLVPR